MQQRISCIFRRSLCIAVRERTHQSVVRGVTNRFSQNKLHKSNSAKALGLDCYLESTMVIFFEGFGTNDCPVTGVNSLLTEMGRLSTCSDFRTS